MTDSLVPPLVYPARERIVAAARRDLTAELNPEQAAAAVHGDGPLLIIAGAGTGKTRTLVYRVAHLIESGVAPERILLLTFTRRAAHEMLSRAERLVGSASARVQGGTFHATGHRLLRQFGPEAGLPRDFSIMDQGDAEDLMQLARANLGFGKQEKRFPKKESLHYIYSRHLNAELSVEEILESEYPQFVEFTRDVVRIFAEYTSRKSERNLVDYDDLLLFWALMLEQSASIGDRIAALHDHILVDEYQDTNLLQARILRAMCRRHSNVTVVGDDAQSIYSFRGASFRNILDFPRQFAGAAVVTLEQNYRSTQPILDTTNTLISRALERFTKTLWTVRSGGDAPWLVTARDEQQQTRFVVDRILELHESGTPLHEIAVLVRAGYMSADLEIELANRKIPFEKWGGLKFLEAAHVKDVLAFLRVLENPRDEVSWYRILLMMPGIGDVTARAMMDSMADRAWDPDAFSHFVPPSRARDAHRELVALLRRLRAAGDRHADASVGEDIDEIRVALRQGARRAVRPLRAAPCRSGSAARDRRGISEPLGVPRGHRARAAAEHAGSLRRIPGRGRRAGHQHGAQRQGQRVGRGVRHLGRRRLVSVVTLDRRRGTTRGGAETDVRGDDASPEPPRGHVPAARLRHAERRGLLHRSTVSIPRSRCQGEDAARRAAGIRHSGAGGAERRDRGSRSASAAAGTI